MRTILILLAGTLLAAPLEAVIPVTERFNGASLDQNRWELDQPRNARLRQAKGRLNLVIPKTHPEEDYAAIELRGIQPGVNDSWRVTVDVVNKSGQGGRVGAGFWIFNAADPTDMLFLKFHGNPRKARKKVAAATFVNDGDYLPDSFSLKDRRRQQAKLRVTYNGKTKLFTFHVGFANKGGVKWKRLGTFSPTGSGGDIRTNWNMNPVSGRFGIRLEGFGVRRVVANGKVSMDNFQLEKL